MYLKLLVFLELLTVMVVTVREVAEIGAAIEETHYSGKNNRMKIGSIYD